MDEIDALLHSLHEHLEATADQSLDDGAAEQVETAMDIAAELAENEVDNETAHERVQTVLDHLEEIEKTGDDTAEEHLEAARRAGQRVLER